LKVTFRILIFYWTIHIPRRGMLTLMFLPRARSNPMLFKVSHIGTISLLLRVLGSWPPFPPPPSGREPDGKVSKSGLFPNRPLCQAINKRAPPITINPIVVPSIQKALKSSKFESLLFRKKKLVEIVSTNIVSRSYSGEFCESNFFVVFFIVVATRK
jgi:hypothetical protein